MAIVTIIGSGMMGSALAFPARENGHTVRLVGTHLDREIIDTCRKTADTRSLKRIFPPVWNIIRSNRWKKPSSVRI